MTVDRTRPANSFVGSPIERIEDLRFLRGKGRYVDDVSPAGLLYAVILRSPVAHGRIRGIDRTSALARPGARAVITATDIGNVPTIPLRQEQLAAFKLFEQPVIAVDKVRYVGEPVAVVVADTAAGAEDAAEAVAIDIEELPVVSDCAAAESGGTTLFETTSNLAGTLTAVKGDANAAFRTAAYVRREQFKVQRHTAVPMEPRGFVGTQGPPRADRQAGPPGAARRRPVRGALAVAGVRFGRTPAGAAARPRAPHGRGGG